MLPREVVDRLAAWGTLLRVFAEPGDRLWTLTPVDPARLLGLPEVVLESGDPSLFEERGDGLDIVSWAQARPWVDEATAEIAARVNHRAFGLDLARSLDLAPPGSSLVAGIDSLRRLVEEAGPAVFPRGFLVKAPLSAAGRGRFAGRDVDALDDSKLAKLFHVHGELLVEPLHDRVEDFGVVFEVEETGAARDVSVHHLLTDGRGTFRGIEIGTVIGTAGDSERGVRSRLENIAREAARALAAEGYVGPAGVDAYRHRLAHGADEGRVVLRPLVEVNARHTFGTIARAIVRRLVGDAGRGTLRLGDARDLPGSSFRGDSILLVAPDDHGRGAAWFEAWFEA